MAKDSLITPVDTLKASGFIDYPHVFAGHQLSAKDSKIIDRQLQVSTWPVFVLLFAFALLVYLRINSARNFFQVLRSFFSLSYTRQLVREEYRLNKGTSIALVILFIVSTSLFLLKVNQYYGFYAFGPAPFNQFLLLSFIIALVYAFKIIINKLLVFVVREHTRIEEYTFTIFMMNKAVGFFLFPIVIGLYYTGFKDHQLIIAGLVIALFFYCIRVYRGIYIGFANKGFSIFHLFLYLCTLELLPMAVLIKLLVCRV